MNEWLDDTINQILTSHGINHSLDILELGTGSGMISPNLTKNLRSYHGLDASPNAVDFVGATALTIPELDSKLHLYLGTTLDFHLLGTVAPTLAIINSVVQYFPSSSYLLNVIQGLLRLKGIRTIFLGDVRSYALEEEFSVSRALDKLGAKASKAEVRKEMTQAYSEVLVDPAFFTKHELNREHLLCRLKASTEDIMAVSNIPYSKTIFERHVIGALQEAAEESPDWLSMARSKSEALPSLSAKDLDIIAEQASRQGIRSKSYASLWRAYLPRQGFQARTS